MPSVSIIVPVYNVEKYLKRCVESLQKQTLKNIEIILVDDGSQDNSPAICDNIKKQDRRIQVIHKKNGGLSSARNAGLKIARGTYVGFVDSDDDVELDMYEKMLETIESENVDFVMSDYQRIFSDGKSCLKTLEIDPGRYDQSELQRVIFPSLIMGEKVEYGPLLSVCHCLYRAEFLQKNNIFFDEEVRWSEDNIFSAIVGYHAESFYYMKGQGLYHYYQNPGTITTGYRPGAWKVYCTMNRHLCDVFGKVKEYDFRRQLKLHIIYYACNCIRQACSQPKKKALSEIQEVLCSDILVDAFDGFQMPQVNAKLKVQLYLMKRKAARLLYTSISK